MRLSPIDEDVLYAGEEPLHFPPLPALSLGICKHVSHARLPPYPFFALPDETFYLLWIGTATHRFDEFISAFFLSDDDNARRT